MSASASQSNPTTTTQSQQQTVQGSAGANSPTVSAGQTVNYNDPALSLSALQIAGQAITTALSGVLTNQGNLQTDVAQQGAQQQSSNSDLIANVLAAEQNLAAYQGSGGAIQQSTSTNYVIWGAIAIAAIAVLSLFFGKRN